VCARTFARRLSTTWRFDVGLDRPVGLDGSRGLDGLRHENLDEQEAAERRVDVRERRRDDEDRVRSLLRRRPHAVATAAVASVRREVSDALRTLPGRRRDRCRKARR
jgi:hypothetical protein